MKKLFVGLLFGALCFTAPLVAQGLFSFPTWTTATRTGASPGAAGFNIQTNLPEYLDNNLVWHSFAASGSSTIQAGATATTGITSGHLIGSTGNLAVDSGIAAANVAQNGSAANFPSVGATTPGSGAFTTLSTTGFTSTGTSVFGGSIRVPVRTAVSATDNISATTDYFICPLNATLPATENLPATPGTGLTYLIKDCGGTAATHNITIVPAAGNIDGAVNFVMSTNFQSIAVTYNGSQWSIN